MELQNMSIFYFCFYFSNLDFVSTRNYTRMKVVGLVFDWSPILEDECNPCFNSLIRNHARYS